MLFMLRTERQMSQLTIDDLIRVRSIYRTIRRERGDTFASLPREADWLLFRYVRSDSIRRMAAVTFSDPPVIALHPLAFAWENTLLLKGLIHHELCHLICGHQAGHGEEFQALEQAWLSYQPYVLQRNAFNRKLIEDARLDGLFHEYQCPNCGLIIERTRPLKANTACSSCCKALNGGKWCEAYTFKKVVSVG